MVGNQVAEQAKGGGHSAGQIVGIDAVADMPEDGPPGEAAGCTVRWRERSHDFVDSCGGRIYPADGAGLTSYRASVDRKGDLIVDLRRPLA